ncbi:MAG: hypothetical protein RJA22_2387 [Verrucomicrobiota bacterium]|jgi:signal transduction histidine kinase
MNRPRWERLGQLRALLRETAPPPDRMAARLQTVERDVVLPVKAVFLLILVNHLYFQRWFENVNLPQTDAQWAVQRFFGVYLALNAVVAGVLLFRPRMEPVVLQRFIFASNFSDGVLVGLLTYMTGGVDSILYWIFPALILRNAVSCPLAASQLILNFTFSLVYLAASLIAWFLERSTSDFRDELRLPGEGEAFPTESFLLRLIVLWLAAAWGYAMQVLFEKNRRAAEESREFAVRQEQLRSAGRLAARIAHQIKNPLGIINNAAYSLQRALQEGKPASPGQVAMIREEVARADQTLNRLMGYSQLAEGRVERLDLAGEIARAVEQALPPAAHYPVRVETDLAPGLPVLLMQRAHLSEILVNLLQNAREAFEGRPGVIRIAARPAPDACIELTIADDGPGIPSDRLERIFEAYYTTKPRGTGLGLAIVKQDLELYGALIRVESQVGKGTRFLLHIPTRTVPVPA